jgi:hypothetical protein
MHFTMLIKKLLADSVDRLPHTKRRANALVGLATKGIIGLSALAAFTSAAQVSSEEGEQEGWIIDPATGVIVFPGNPNGSPEGVDPFPWTVDLQLNLPDRVILKTESSTIHVVGQIEATDPGAIEGLSWKLDDGAAQELEWDPSSGFYRLTVEGLERGTYIIQVTATLDSEDPLIGQALIEVTDLTGPAIELNSLDGMDDLAGLEWIRVESVPTEIVVTGTITDPSGIADAQVEIIKEWMLPTGEPFDPEDFQSVENLALDEAGAFSFAVEQTNSGMTHVIVSATDTLGNTSSRILIIEAFPPIDPPDLKGDGQGPKIHISEANYTTAFETEFIRIEDEGDPMELSFFGQVEDPAGVASFTLEIIKEYIDPAGSIFDELGIPITVDIALDESGEFSLDPIEVLPGFTTFIWTAADSDGNFSSIQTFVEYNKIEVIDPNIDRTAPVIEITSSNIADLTPAFGWFDPFVFTQESELNLEGLVVDQVGNIVSVTGSYETMERGDLGERLVEQVIELDENGAFSWTGIPIGTEFTMIHIVAVDESGNAGSWDLIIQNFDRIPPKIEITSPSNGEILSESSIVLSGSVSDASQVESIWVELNGVPWTEIIGDSEAFSVEITGLEQGRNILMLMARDNYGNESADFLALDYSLGTNAEPLWTVSTETTFTAIGDVLDSARAMAPESDSVLESVEMSISADGDQMRLSWPSLVQGKIQWSDSMGSDAVWLEVDATLARLLNGQRHVNVPTQTEGAVFFRMVVE